MSDSGDEVLRRHFIAVATGSYDDPKWELQPLAVAEELKQIQQWLCAEDLGPRRFRPDFVELAANPTEEQVWALRDIARHGRWTAGDAAVVYITGHGETADDTHYLILKRTDSTMLAVSAVRTADVIGWLAHTAAENVLVIIDACFAGKVAADVLRFDKDLPARWVVLPSATRRQRAVVGALTQAIAGFLEDLRSDEGRRYGEGPYIDIGAFLEDVGAKLAEAGHDQKLVPLSGSQLIGPHVCLPNPHYRTGGRAPVAAARHDLALPRRELESHWDPRSRGVAAGAPGWLFNGRAGLMEELIAAATGEPGATVVTGGAGSGKSTVLARLVTLGDHQFLEQYRAEVATIPSALRPPPGAVDVAVVATHKLHTEVLAQICTAVGVPVVAGIFPEPDVKERLAPWHAWLAARDEPLTIVLDALDEAAQPEELLKVLAGLDPDQGRRRVRLLIGVRSFAAAGNAGSATRKADADLADTAVRTLNARRITVDDAPFWSQDEVVGYVAGVLRQPPGSPYRTTPEPEVAALADALGHRAGRSFLVAGIAAAALAHRARAVSATEPGWRAALDAGVVGVFRDDLRQSVANPSDRRRVVVLMRATAFAYGLGLPWRKIWPVVAHAVDDDGGHYGDHEISQLLHSRLGAYVVSDTEDDTTVYRLSHDLLRSTLRESWRELLDPQPGGPRPPAGNTVIEDIRSVEARIARELVRLVEVPEPGGPMRRPLPYLRRHLVEHAAAGNVLDDRFLPPAFLPYLDPSRLRLVTSRSTVGGSGVLGAWRHVAHGWDWDDPALNADALRFRLAAVGHAAGKSVWAPGVCWTPRWLRWTREDVEILARHTSGIWCVATAVLPGGREIVVAGCDDGTIGRWDLLSGEQCGDPLTGHEGAVRTIATAVLRDGRAVVVTGSTDGTSGVWDLENGAPVGVPLKTEDWVMSAATFCLPDGRVVALTHSREEASIRVRDVQTGAPDDALASEELATGQSLAAAVLPDGRAVAVAVTTVGAVDVIDLRSGDVVHQWDRSSGDTLETIRGRAHSVVTGVLADGRVVAIIGGNGELWVHDLDSGADILSSADEDEDNAFSGKLAALTLADGRLLVVVSGDPLRVWTVGPRRIASSWIPGVAPQVRSIAAGVLANGRAVAVAGGADGAIRVWDLDHRRNRRQRPTSADRVNALCRARLRNGREVVVHSGLDKTVQVCDLRTGALLRRFDTGLQHHANSVAAATLVDGRVAVVVASGFAPWLHALDPEDGKLLGSVQTDHWVGVTALATAVLPNGKAVLASAGTFGSGIQLWDLATGTRMGPVLRGPFAGAHEIRHVRRDDGKSEFVIGGDDKPLNGLSGIKTIDVVVRADGRVVAVAGADDGTVCAWDLSDRRRLGSLVLPCAVMAAATETLPDGRTVLVYGGSDGTLHVVDVDAMACIGTPITALPGPVYAITTVSMAGRTAIVAGGDDGFLHVRDLASGCQIRHPLLVGAPVQSVLGVNRRRAPHVLVAGLGLACMELAL